MRKQIINCSECKNEVRVVDCFDSKDGFPRCPICAKYIELDGFQVVSADEESFKLDVKGTPRTILMCGSRNWANSVAINRIFDALVPHCPLVRPTIVHGAAKGADSLCASTAIIRGWRVKPFKADWSVKPDTPKWAIRSNQYGTYDVRAGGIRNQKMLDEGKPELVIAFGTGKGTDSMVKLAAMANVPVIRVC